MRLIPIYLNKILSQLVLILGFCTLAIPLAYSNVHEFGSAYTITPKTVPSLADLQSGVFKIYAGKPFTIDVSQSSIPTGTIDFIELSIFTQTYFNPNITPKDFNITGNGANGFECRHKSFKKGVGPLPANSTYSNGKLVFTCVLPVPGPYKFYYTLFGNVNTWFYLNGFVYYPQYWINATQSYGVRGRFKTGISFNVLPNPDVPFITNQAPVALAKIPTTVLLSPANVNYPNGKPIYNSKLIKLDGSASFDPDGRIVNYRWYVAAIVDNNVALPGTTAGTISVVALNKNDTQPLASAIFSKVGLYDAIFEVTDDRGATTLISRKINVIGDVQVALSATAILRINPFYVTVGANIRFSGDLSFGPLKTGIESYEFTYQKVDTAARPSPKNPNPGSSSPTACKQVTPGGTVIFKLAAREAITTHIFTAADQGLMDIFLTVTDRQGNTGTTCERITVY